MKIFNPYPPISSVKPDEDRVRKAKQIAAATVMIIFILGVLLIMLTLPNDADSVQSYYTQVEGRQTTYLELLNETRTAGYEIEEDELTDKQKLLFYN